MSETGAGEHNIRQSVEGSRVKQAFRRGWNVILGGERNGEVDLRSLPLVGAQIAELDNQVGIKGMPLAVKEYSQKLGLNILPEYAQSLTEEALRNDPVLLIALHPQLTEAVGIIGGLPTERRNVFLLAGSLFANAGEKLSEHIIPIFGLTRRKTKNIRSRLWRETGFEQSPPSPMQAARLNVESLAIARQRVDEGGLVIIFPEGAKGKDEDWFNGIGELVRELKDNPRAKVIFAIAEGSKSRDKLRIVPKVAQLLGPTEFKVKFSEPHPVNEYLNGQYTRQSITRGLRNQYNLFSSSR